MTRSLLIFWRIGKEELKKSNIESYISKMMLYVQNTGLTPSELKDEEEKKPSPNSPIGL